MSFLYNYLFQIYANNRNNTGNTKSLYTAPTTKLRLTKEEEQVLTENPSSMALSFHKRFPKNRINKN